MGFAHAGLDECLRDAKTHGNHTSPVSPSDECVDIIKTLPERIEIKTSKAYFYGYKHMMYAELGTTRKLLAGDQTELNDILKIRINHAKNKFLVIQKNSISTYGLDLIGNVSPIKFFKSPILKNASDAKLLDNEEMIVIFSAKNIRIINAEAESRHEDSRYKPKLLNEISGENSQLNNPTDLVINSSEKKIYVLDSNRLLVFSANVKKDQAPLKIIKLDEARSLKQKENLIFYVNTKGQETQIVQDN